MSVEAVAGLADKEGLSKVELAVEELWEEVGLRASPASLRWMMATMAGVGTAATRLDAFYVEAEPEAFDLAAGGGVAEDGERIEKVFLPVEDLDRFLASEPRPASLTAMLLWWKADHAPRVRADVELGIADQTHTILSVLALGAGLGIGWLTSRAIAARK
jgi:8-oxo-dGTP pyrophosphatase MutT (NUDIX family)